CPLPSLGCSPSLTCQGHADATSRVCVAVALFCRAILDAAKNRNRPRTAALGFAPARLPDANAESARLGQEYTDAAPTSHASRTHRSRPRESSLRRNQSTPSPDRRRIAPDRLRTPDRPRAVAPAELDHPH